jgi:hypothetical protein
MKKWVYWVAGIAELIVLVGIIVIIAIVKASWFWVLGIFLFLFFADMIALGIIFYLSRRIDLSKAEKEPEEIIEKIKYKTSHDTDNPDNFIYRWHFLYSIGERGTAPVKILRIHGVGSELGDDIDWLVNLENSQDGRLNNKSDEFVKSEMLRMAGFPEADILEEKQTSYDDFGRPITKVLSKRLSPMQKKEEEEKKKLEEENSM